MIATMRPLWLAVAIFLAPAAGIWLGNPSPTEQDNRPVFAPADAIRVTLSTDRATYKVGQPLHVTVIVENVGSDILYLSPRLNLTTSDTTGFELRIFDEDGKQIPIKYLHGDSFGVPRDVVDRIRVSYLLMLPGNFLGYRGELREPPQHTGRYRLVGVYYDRTVDWFDDQQREALKTLTFPVWFGEIRTEPVWVTITD